MEAEIRETPVLDRILTDTAQITEVAARVREPRPRMVLFAGRGTSDHAVLYAKYLVQTVPTPTVSWLGEGGSPHRSRCWR